MLIEVQYKYLICSIDSNMGMKTIEDKVIHAKPLVSSKKKQKMYYYKKNKLSKNSKDFMSYILSSNSKMKESGEYSINQNLTIDSVDIPNAAKQFSSITYSKPKIS